MWANVKWIINWNNISKKEKQIAVTLGVVLQVLRNKPAVPCERVDCPGSEWLAAVAVHVADASFDLALPILAILSVCVCLNCLLNNWYRSMFYLCLLTLSLTIHCSQQPSLFAFFFPFSVCFQSNRVNFATCTKCVHTRSEPSELASQSNAWYCFLTWSQLNLIFFRFVDCQCMFTWAHLYKAHSRL